MLHEKFSDTELLLIAKNSNSIADFCRKLGYKSTTSYRKNVQNRLELLRASIQKKAHYKHTDKEVLSVVEEAESVTEIMRRLGLNYNGYAHARFTDRLRKLGVDVDNLTGAAWNRGKKIGPKRRLDEYLVKDGPFITSSKLRKRLIQEGIKNNQCEECKQNNIWNGLLLVLQLDHRNGNRSDNTIENLRILCPNCHTQTKTHSRIKKT